MFSFWTILVFVTPVVFSLSHGESFPNLLSIHNSITLLGFLLAGFIGATTAVGGANPENGPLRNAASFILGIIVSIFISAIILAAIIFMQAFFGS